MLKVSFMILRARSPYRFITSSSFCSSVKASNIAAVKSDLKHDEIVHFREQTVKIETCGKLYDEWRQKKRFRTVPSGGLTFDVRYVDTHCDESEEVKANSSVVLAMHGAPGTYMDFKILTSFLFQRGLRVIAPSFPDFTTYPPGVFRHSIDEKIQYIKDFLNAIGILHVDLLVCHSSATYPGLKLCLDNHQPSISTLALLNPGAPSTKMSSTKFFPCLKWMVSICETPAGLEFFKSVGPDLLKLINVPVRVDNFLDPLLSATAMVYADIPKARENLNDLSLRKFPIFLAFSENDKMVQKQLSYMMAYKLRAQDEEIWNIAEDGTVAKKGRIVNNVQAMAFEKGSHYVFSKYPDIVNEAIYSFLKRYVL